jgi:ABC-type Zn2+ transport system substrate-binding protein/surface adhesin
MDLSQFIIIVVAVAGAVIVGLLAIVPTLLELPRRRESSDRPDAAGPAPITPPGGPGHDGHDHDGHDHNGHDNNGHDHDGPDHRLAA